MSGKNYTDALKGFDRDQVYTPSEALGIVKNVAKGGFDESVDVSVRLGVDPRKADQMVRGTVALPAGTGKDVRVAVCGSRRITPRRCPSSGRCRGPAAWQLRGRWH
jgi:large subunit ribosomal protein L1